MDVKTKPFNGFSVSTLPYKNKKKAGGFANVFLCAYQNERYALKQVKSEFLSSLQENYDFQADFEREVQLTSQLRHPNIIELIAVCREPTHLAMLLEYAERYFNNFVLIGLLRVGIIWYIKIIHRGSLFHQLHEVKRIFSVAEKIKILSQVAVGIKHLHHFDPKIIHRDLKSQK